MYRHSFRRYESVRMMGNRRDTGEGGEGLWGMWS